MMLLDFCLNTNVIKREYIFKTFKERHLCALPGMIRHTNKLFPIKAPQKHPTQRMA